MSWQEKRVRRMNRCEHEEDETTTKNFSSLPVQLRELILSKTGTYTRLKLFQINNEMRKWVLKKELFGEDLEQIRLWDSEISIKPRYGSGRTIDLRKQNVFKFVRHCKALISYSGATLTRIFPRLESIDVIVLNHFKNFTGLSEMFKSSTIQVTGYCGLHYACVERMTSHMDEILLPFIHNHVKRCKTINFGRYPLDKLFDFLGTQRFPLTIFRYGGNRMLLNGFFDFERDLKMILRNGIPGLHSDSAIWMYVDLEEAGYLSRIIRIILEKEGLLVDTEVIKNKFLVSYEKLGGSWMREKLGDGWRERLFELRVQSGPVRTIETGPIQYINDANVEFFGLKRKFDDTRNLIFLVYRTEHEIHVHLKFDPIAE